MSDVLVVSFVCTLEFKIFIIFGHVVFAIVSACRMPSLTASL